MIFQSSILHRNAYNNCEIIFNSNALAAVEESSEFRYIYPHEFDDVVVLVENIVHVDRKVHDFYIFSGTLVTVFGVALACDKLLRILSHDSSQKISCAAIHTLGLFLATNARMTATKLPMKIFQFSIILFSILLSIFASAFLFGWLLARTKFDNIDRLDELAETNLKIFIQPDLNQTIDKWSQNLE